MDSNGDATVSDTESPDSNNEPIQNSVDSGVNLPSQSDQVLDDNGVEKFDGSGVEKFDGSGSHEAHNTRKTNCTKDNDDVHTSDGESSKRTTDINVQTGNELDCSSANEDVMDTEQLNDDNVQMECSSKEEDVTDNRMDSEAVEIEERTDDKEANEEGVNSSMEIEEQNEAIQERSDSSKENIAIVEVTAENETRLERNESHTKGFIIHEDSNLNKEIEVNDMVDENLSKDSESSEESPEFQDKVLSSEESPEVQDRVLSSEESSEVQDRVLSDEESYIITTNTVPSSESSSSNDSVKVDERQISDHTVSSSNNQIDDIHIGVKSKQNENIFEKIQMTSHFDNDISSESRGDNSLTNLETQSRRQPNMISNIQLACNTVSESERETTDDDIMNFSIEIREDSDEESDNVGNVNSNHKILDDQDKVTANDNQRNDSEIHHESSLLEKTSEPTSSYIQKISSVIRAIDSSKSCTAIRAIDSSKSCTALKRDRDNIFSVLKAEISTNDMKDPIIIKHSDDKGGKTSQDSVNDEQNRCEDLERSEGSKINSEISTSNRSNKTTTCISLDSEKNTPNLSSEAIIQSKNTDSTQEIVQESIETNENSLNQQKNMITEPVGQISAQQFESSLVYDTQINSDPVQIGSSLQSTEPLVHISKESSDPTHSQESPEPLVCRSKEITDPTHLVTSQQSLKPPADTSEQSYDPRQLISTGIIHDQLKDTSEPSDNQIVHSTEKNPEQSICNETIQYPMTESSLKNHEPEQIVSIEQTVERLEQSSERKRDPVIVSPPLRVDGERSFMQALIPPFQSDPRPDSNLSGVKVKVEKDLDDIFGQPMEESGDILDILPGNNKTSRTTLPKNNETPNTVSVAGTFQPAAVRIKQEPVDNYNTPASTSSSSNTPVSSSLEHLSRQVNNLPKANNIARKSTTGKPPAPKRFKGQDIPNSSNVRYPPIPMVISRNNVTGKMTIRPPAIVQNQRPTHPSQKPVVNIPSQKPVVNIPSQKPVINIPSQKPVINIPSQKPVVNIPPPRPVEMYSNIPGTTKPGSVVSNIQTLTIISNGQTVNVPTSSIFSVTKVAPSTTTAPKLAPLTTTAPKTAVPKVTASAPLPKSTINIDTVGLNAITELIARKNPIPNYKPPPIPDSLKPLIAEDKCKNICYECGDTFLFESSLRVHRARTSMSLSYRCEECKQTRVFFNKCQFLGHLRNHLNIDKSQAVPIHIKSDSISITTLDHAINMQHLFKWLDDIPTTPQSLPRKQEVSDDVCITEDMSKQNKDNTKDSVTSKSVRKAAKSDDHQLCHECGTKCTDLREHFGYELNGETQYCCSTCKKSLPTICSARAHKRIHEDKEPYVCPECGKSFSSLYVDNKMTNQKESFAYHVYYTCFHTCRMRKITCAKCEKTDKDGCTSFQDYQYKWHLSEKLEQYYKCQICPMAFKLPQSFLKHFVTHDPKDFKRKSFKVIYRCHLCDSVMDDKSVLDMHIMKHVNEARYKSVMEFRCRFCKEWFKTREDLRTHVDKNHAKLIQNPDKTSTEMFTCAECGKKFTSLFEILKHEIHFYSNKCTQAKMLSSKCRACGIIIYGSLWKDHFCLNPNPFKLVQQNNKLQGVENPQIMPKEEDNTESKYTCELCFKEEPSFKSLQGHLLYHQTKGDLVCYICQQRDFSTLAEVHAHQRNCPQRPKLQINEKVKKVKKMASTNTNTSVEYPCDVCGFTCYNKTDLAKHHKENHSETGINPCHLCGSTYESQELLKKHIMATHEGKRLLLFCEICHKRGIKKSFSTRKRLEKHLTSRHKVAKNKTKYVSSMNEVSSPDVETNPIQDSLKRKFEENNDTAPVKKLRVDGDAQFTCAKCLYSSNDRTEFVNHLTEHKVDNCVQCLECGLSFAVMPSLKKHLFMVHKIKDFENYCKENNLSELPEAKMDDSEIRKGLLMESESDDVDTEVETKTTNPLECRVCYKVFDNEAAVKAHLRTHGMAFIRNRRSKAPSQSRDSINSSEASDGGSK